MLTRAELTLVTQEDSTDKGRWASFKASACTLDVAGADQPDSDEFRWKNGENRCFSKQDVIQLGFKSNPFIANDMYHMLFPGTLCRPRSPEP